MLDIAALLVTLTALFSYVNYKLLRLPTTIGVMLIALLLSLLLVILGEQGHIAIREDAERLVRTIDFNEVLMHGMLSFLLFAGAMHVDLGTLASRKWSILILATAGVLVSTFIIGIAAWFVFLFVGLQIPLIYCLLFGALISPTDPIAVLGILKSAKAPESLEIKIVGESLFNDGVAVVVFTILLTIALGGEDLTVGHIGLLFVEEAVGGAAFGLAIGLVAYVMLRTVDSYHVEVLITLGLVMGGYALAIHLHVSGPIAMVVAGLMIGNHGRSFAMSDQTREHLDTFWEIVDEVLNAVLFVLIGLEMIILTFTEANLTAAAVMIPLVLLTRLICVGVPVNIMRNHFRQEFSPHAVKLLTWGGIRGGISVALALSLPQGPEREILLVPTYAIVLFSIVVQGLSIGWVVRRAIRDDHALTPDSQGTKTETLPGAEASS